MAWRTTSSLKVSARIKPNLAFSLDLNSYVCLPAVLEKELPAIHEALNLHGYPDGAIKVSIIVCQKGHHTRLFYEESNGEYLNPCPGLCVDARGGLNSISDSAIVCHPFLLPSLSFSYRFNSGEQSSQ